MGLRHGVFLGAHLCKEGKQKASAVKANVVIKKLLNTRPSSFKSATWSLGNVAAAQAALTLRARNKRYSLHKTHTHIHTDRDNTLSRIWISPGVETITQRAHSRQRCVDTLDNTGSRSGGVVGPVGVVCVLYVCMYVGFCWQ